MSLESIKDNLETYHEVMSTALIAQEEPISQGVRKTAIDELKDNLNAYHSGPMSPAKTTSIDENSLMVDMTESQRILFQTQMNGVRKSRTTGFVLTFFLGGLGAHHYYLGKVGLGILYTLFCWTFVPGIIAFIELFFIMGRVDAYNQEKAIEIANKVKSLG